VDFKQGGQAIQRIRKERGMTQEQLAEITNVASNSISRIERGLLIPALPTLIDICNALGTGADSILSAYAMPLGLVLIPSYLHTLQRILRFDGHLWQRSWEGWIWRSSIRSKLSLAVWLRLYDLCIYRTSVSKLPSVKKKAGTSSEVLARNLVME